MRIPKNYRKSLEYYLSWFKGDGISKESFNLDKNGPTAEEAMFAWETLGKTLPLFCSNPELLRKYVDGKRWLDWHTKEWASGIREGIITPMELEESCDPITWKRNKKQFFREYANYVKSVLTI